MQKQTIAIIISLIVLAVIIGLGVLELEKQQRKQPIFSQEKENLILEEKQLTNLRAGAGLYGFTWSPDGKQIAFVVYSREGTFNIWTMNSDGGNQKRLTTFEENAGDPSWSPDGKKIAYISNKEGEIFLRERLDGSNEQVRKNNIWIMDSDGGNQKRLTGPESEDSFPSWSPDGKKIAYLSYQDVTVDIWIMDSDGSNQKRSIGDSREKWNPSWSADGKKIKFEAAPFDLESWAGFLPLPPHNLPQELWIMDSDGANQKLLRKVEGTESVVKSIWRPDSEKIAFELYKDGGYSIWAMNSDGSNQKRLTKLEEDASDPSWSPDSKRIAFSLFQKNNSDIWIMDSDGGSLRQLTIDKMDDNNPSWGPDGKKIIFSRGEIWVIVLPDR